MNRSNAILWQWRLAALTMIVIAGVVMTAAGTGPWWHPDADPIEHLVTFAVLSVPIIAVLGGIGALAQHRTGLRAVLDVAAALWTGWWSILTADLFSIKHSSSIPSGLYLVAAAEAVVVLLGAWAALDLIADRRGKDRAIPDVNGAETLSG